MATRTISITRALSELKLLDKRIKDGTNSLKVAINVNKGKVPVGFDTQADFITKGSDGVASVVALISNRAAIKAAIVASNAATKVTLDKRTMTVAEAIERKASIEYEEALLVKLSTQLAQARTGVEQTNVRVREAANQAAITILGADAKKSDPAAYQQNYDAYMTRNEAEVLAVKDLEKKIDELKAGIEDFLTEVDFVLSESNTKTMITIPE